MASLSITWVLPGPAFTGGVRVVYEHSRELLARGHRVAIVVRDPGPGAPWTAAGRTQLRSWLVERVLMGDEALRHYGLARHVRRVEDLERADLGDADVLIATAWQTARSVLDAPARSGRKAYFLQHYEAFTPEIVSSVDETWRWPLEKIVIASWLARLARDRFGTATWGPVVNGVDASWFRPPAARREGPLTVGMMYELQPWKGVEDGLAAIARARAAGHRFRLVLFGRYRLRHALEPGDRYVRNPSQRALAELYRECHIFLSPSWTEGCGLPPMEAMASGCAVVATEVGGIPDVAIPERTVITAPPRDPERLASGLDRLLANASLRERIAAGGREHIAHFTWPRATDQLLAALERIAAGESAPLVHSGS